jgi:hypothetical protein
MLIRRSPALVLFLFCALALPAAPITIQLSGRITQVPIDDLFHDLVAGDAVQISYTFDSTAADQVPGDGSTGSYLSVGFPYAMTFTFPTRVFTGADSIHIGILNSFVDQYTVYAVGSGGNDTLELFLQDNGGTVFADDSLPLTAPALAAFTLKDFHLRIVSNDGETQVDGQLDDLTVIPEPSSALLTLAGATALMLAVLKGKTKT